MEPIETCDHENSIVAIEIVGNQTRLIGHGKLTGQGIYYCARCGCVDVVGSYFVSIVPTIYDEKGRVDA